MATQLAEQPQAPEAVIAAGAEETQERDFEAEARVQGWRSEHEFKGDPSKWTDAETFVKRGEEILPFVRKENAHLKQKVDMLERSLKKLSKLEQQAYSSALDQLRREQEEAVQTGDIATFRELNGKIDKLKEEAAPETSATNGEDPSAIYRDFRRENLWYDKANLASANDTEVAARLFADQTMEDLVARGYDKSHPPSEFFAEVKRIVEDKFPALNARPARLKPVEAVAGVTNGRGKSGARTGGNLPPEAKAAAERYWKSKLPGFGSCATREEAWNLFAKDYDWSE